MRVAVLHNAVASDAPRAEQDVLVQVDAVIDALQSLGHEAVPLPCTLDLAAARQRLEDISPDVAFNLVEALAGSDWLAILATALLDALQLPYTGTATAGLLLSNDKLLAKQWLTRAGLPTPAWLAAQANSTTDPKLPAPVFQANQRYIVKAVTEHASLGLDEASLIKAEDEASLQASLEQMSAARRCRCFAEQYVDGREFNLSVLAGPKGPEVLPPAEIDFSAFPPGKARIVGASAKWEEASFEYVNTPRSFDFPGTDCDLLEQLGTLAGDCWQLFALGGYARVDFRVDTAGKPWILEINANPCLSPDAGFAAALAQASIPWETAVERILDDAVSPKC